MAQATFYTVKGPRGEYYAVRDHPTGRFFTERTELAARQQAADERLDIVEELAVDHAQLLELMIRHSSAALAAQNASGAAASGANPSLMHPSLRIESGISRFFNRFRRGQNAGSHGASSYSGR